MMKQQQDVIFEDNLSSASDLIHATESLGQENGSSSYHPNHQPYFAHPPPTQSQPLIKKKRNLPGNPDPEAEVISLSPKTLMATNRFVCEMCNKGFQRDQNLQLHRRGHNLPWKLKQRNKNEVVRKKVYVCPEVNCVHHEPSRALGDLTGIKKHFCRKHGEKKWKCDKCSKRYAVQSDWKAHSKTCGTREYKCDCGTLFSRRDSFITHRAFCDALAEESARAITGINPTHMIPVQIPTHHHFSDHLVFDPIHPSIMKKEENLNQNHQLPLFPSWLQPQSQEDLNQHCCGSPNTSNTGGPTLIAAYHPAAAPSAYMSATALLQKAAQMGTTHLSRNGTTQQAPCTTSSSFTRPHHQQYTAHVSAPAASAAGAGNNTCGTTVSSGGGDLLLLQEAEGTTACAGGPEITSLPLPMPPPLPSSMPHHPSSLFIHPVNMSMMTMMMMSSSSQDSFADVSSFDDAFSQILDAKREDDDQQMMMQQQHKSNSGNVGNIGGGGRGNVGMTRDFLGLKPSLSHSQQVDDQSVSMNPSLKPWQHD